MTKKEEELQKYLIQIEQYKEQLSSLEVQFQLVQNTILDFSKAKITLEQLQKINDANDVLIPIGGRAFIDATTTKISKVLMDVGSGIVIEKTPDEVIKNIDGKIEELQKTEERITGFIQKLQSEASKITEKAQQLMADQE